jgi:hypothetical protein
MAGQVSCTTDYAKLVNATAQPAPSLSWYAATLITWPDKAKSTTATLSHGLTGTPDLCIAQSTDSSTSVVVYFGSDVKAAIEKQQITKQREQQAAQVDEALKSAAPLAVSAVTDGAFPDAAALVQALTAQGFYVKTASTTAAATESGTIYVIEGDTTSKQLVLALKGRRRQRPDRDPEDQGRPEARHRQVTPLSRRRRPWPRWRHRRPSGGSRHRRPTRTARPWG